MENIFNNNKNKIFASIGALLTVSSVSLSTAVTSFANGRSDDTIESDVTIETNDTRDTDDTNGSVIVRLNATREADDVELDKTMDNEVVNDKEKEDLKDDQGDENQGDEKGKFSCFKNGRWKTVGMSVLVGAVSGGLGALINHFTDPGIVDGDFKYDFTGKFDSCNIGYSDGAASYLSCK